MLKLPQIVLACLVMLSLVQACGAKSSEEDQQIDELAGQMETGDGLTNTDTESGQEQRDSQPQIPIETNDTNTTNSNATNSADESSSLLQDFAIQGLSDQAVTNQLMLSWSAASDVAVVYDLKLGSDSECEAVIYEYNDLSTASIDLSDINDGTYFLCLLAKVGDEQLEASNHGMRVRFDTTEPPALTQFEVSTLSVAQPAGTSADRLGMLHLSLGFPVETQDYDRLELRYKETSLADCSDGNELPLGSLDFSSDYELDLYLSPGKTYEFLLCIWDAAGNVRSSALASGAITVPANQRVFLSSAMFDGNFAADYNGESFANGLDGADYRCQNLAEGAGLGGKWMAILSDDAEKAKDRLLLYDNGAVIDVLGNSIHSISTSIWLGLQAGIKLNELGADIGANITWTATRVGGENRVGSSCNNWTSAENADFGGYGLSNTTAAADWLGNAGSLGCANSFRIYCLEQALVP